MFLYLSKKISMPNGARLKSISWNSQQGWLTCGGENGLLKVLKLESGPSAGESRENPSSSLSMNQTLEGHTGNVISVGWNENYRKLTSTDERGLIIVWVLFKGMWFEEMINNRNKSVVRDLRWSSDGQKICIVYEDGQVVMGNVDGNRLWAKELNVPLALVEWSPDAKLILFCTVQGTCLVYDYNGSYVTQLVICFISDGDYGSIVGIDWYNGSEGYTDLNAPTLALASETGKIQLMRHEVDEDPVLVDMRMRPVCIKWSPDGGVLAAVGSETSAGSLSGIGESLVQLYSHWGVHLRTLHVPGTHTSALSWEGGGLRLALAVDAFIYLANIRPQYKWAFFGNSTCVYAFKKQDHFEHTVMFWDLNSNDRCCKYVNSLVTVSAAGEHCVLATAGDELGQFNLKLYNAIGNPVESKIVTVEPLSITMNYSHVFVASEDRVYVWRFSGSLQSLTHSPEKCDPSENIIYIDKTQPSSDQDKEEEIGCSSDQICCICSSEKYLLIGCESGIVHRYDLPALNLETKDILQCRPQGYTCSHAPSTSSCCAVVLELNCNSSRLAVIDVNGVLTFYDLFANAESCSEGSTMSSRVPEFVRKDIWSIKWAKDNPDLIAIMEKSRMYILRGTEPEEPVSCTAYLCCFQNLQIQAVQLDELMLEPEEPGKSHVFNHETKSLRDTRQMLLAVDIEDAFLYVEEHSHPRLWMSLAEHALEKLNLSIAEKAFVKCQHYHGIQFVKRLRNLPEAKMRQAEVCVYFEKYDAAQKIYVEMKRLDLAVAMRVKMGHWFLVERLISDSCPGNDALLKQTWNRVADYYFDRQNWNTAAPYYCKAKNFERLADCYYALQKWSDLEGILETQPDDSPLLLNIAQMFASFGICSTAVTGYLRGGDVKAALDCCMELNQWEKAMELGRMYNALNIVTESLTKYTKFLLQSGNPLHAVEVYDKAGQHQQAFKMLNNIAKQLMDRRKNPVEVKKLYVLSALQVEAYRAAILCSNDRQFEKDSTKTMAAATLDGLIQHDAAATLDHSLENAWHGAEAYHWWALAHRELYAGRFDTAMKASWWLRNYEDFINADDIYSLIALTAFYNKRTAWFQSYATCSLAFVKLESSKTISESKRSEISQLALAIFTQHSPAGIVVGGDHSSSRNCPNCRNVYKELDTKCSTKTCSTVFPVCLASGTVILDEDRVQCSTCKHWLMSSKMKVPKHCPLCHGVFSMHVQHGPSSKENPGALTP